MVYKRTSYFLLESNRVWVKRYIKYDDYVGYSDIVTKTTIGVSETTHKRLAEFCGKLRTFDEAINDLLDINGYWVKLVDHLISMDESKPKMFIDEIRGICGWKQDAQK